MPPIKQSYQLQLSKEIVSKGINKEMQGRKSDYNLIKYYTSNESYELDAEIADDLERILGNEPMSP